MTNIWDSYVESNARRFGVPPALVQSVIGAESGGRPNAVSRAGAGGYMQLMPNTYKELAAKHGFGEDRFDPANNIGAGTSYMRQLYDKYGNWPDAIAAYNAGPGRVDRVKAGTATMPAETAAYVPKVMQGAGDMAYGTSANQGLVRGRTTAGMTEDDMMELARTGQMPRPGSGGLLDVDPEKNFYDGLGGLLGKGQTPSQPPGPSVAQPSDQASLGRMNVNSRMDELMQGLLQSPTRGPSMTPGQYQLAGAGEAVGKLAGVHDRKVGFGEILGALGGGLTRGTAAGEQAQRDDRASQFQELGNIGKVQQYQRAEATNAAKVQAARQWAAQARASGDPKLIAIAAAVENDPSLLDNVLPKQAEAAFPKDQTYTLAPGAQRRGPNNEIIADNPRSATPPPQRVRNVTTNDGIFVQNPDGSLGPRVGDRPKPQPQPQSWSEKEAILESDKAVEAGTGSVSALERALELNDKALSGVTAGARTWIDRNLYPGDFGGEATTEFTNLVQGQALQSMKAIFGANPTEGERKALLDLNASIDKAPAERKVILNNAIAMAKARIARETDRGKAMRGGTYFSQGLPPPGGGETGGGMPAGNYVYNPETGELEPQQ